MAIEVASTIYLLFVWIKNSLLICLQKNISNWLKVEQLMFRDRERTRKFSGILAAVDDVPPRINLWVLSKQAYSR